MAIEMHTNGRVVFMRWGSTPVEADVARVLNEFARARRAAGASIGVVEIVPVGVGFPSPRLMRVAGATLQPLGHITVAHGVVIQGDSRRRAIARGIFAAVAFVIGDEFWISRTVADAVMRVCAVVRADPVGALAVAKSLGWTDEPRGGEQRSE
jgi:hypothetical protein